MGDGTNPRTGVLTFPCGGVYECDHDRLAAKVGKNGRVRLLVLDTQNREKPRPPHHADGEAAACLLGCETRKHRRERRLMRDDGADPFAFRVGVVCSAVLRRMEVSRG